MLNYDQEILKVLAFAGADGLHVSKISKHVFNASNSFFFPLNFEEVHSYVSAFLLRHSKNPVSVIEKVSRGVYRLNPSSVETNQLMLKFTNVEENEVEQPIHSDESLSLFQE